MLRTILIQACKISSTKELLQNELKQIENKFIKINDYPKRVFHQVNKECSLSRSEDYDKNITANNASISTTHRLILPYKSEQGRKIINSINNYNNQILPENHAAQRIYRSRKMSSSLNIKNQTKLEHKHDYTYLVECPENTCLEYT